MMSVLGKKENFTILEELYHEVIPKKKPIQSFKQFLQEFFANPVKVEKTLSVSIVVLCLAALGLGFFQIKYKMDYRRLWQTDKTKIAKESTDQNDLLGLKQKDTDNDGLNNYDELYVYGTSPYLPDTDSDGLDDKREVDINEDPNCPQGQNCFGQWPTELSGQNVDYSAIATAQVQSQMPTDPAGIRQILLQSGMAQSDLDLLTDDDLILALQQVLTMRQQGQSVSQADSSGQTTLDAEALKNMSPDDLRSLLVQTGVPLNIVNGVSDSDLISLVQETFGSSASPDSTTNPAPANSQTAGNLNNNTAAEVPAAENKSAGVQGY
jgi:hypothetical protein